MAQHAPLVAVDPRATWTICIDRQPRVSRNGGAERYRAAGSDQAAGIGRGRPKLCKLACTRSEADIVSIGCATMVAGTNSWLAQAHISGGPQKSGVTRDDLSQPVHSGARRAEKRAA